MDRATLESFADSRRPEPEYRPEDEIIISKNYPDSSVLPRKITQKTAILPRKITRKLVELKGKQYAKQLRQLLTCLYLTPD